MSHDNTVSIGNYECQRFPSEIISTGVWLYDRIGLSHRAVGRGSLPSAVLTKYVCKQGHGDRLCAMKPPRSIRHVTDEERAALETGLRSHAAFTVRRCQIVLASAGGQKPSQIATTLHCAPQTVRNVIHAFDAHGMACVQHGSNVPLRVEPVLNAEKREQLRAILHQSPRTFGQPASVWTLKRWPPSATSRA